MRHALLSIELSPKTADDALNLAAALRVLTAADPDVEVRPGGSPDHVVIGGVSEEHLEIVLDWLKREWHVEAGVGRPTVVYREALTRPADGEMKYARQSAGSGEYAHVKLRLHPGAPGSGVVFEDGITGGAIPARFMTAVETGIRDRLAGGVVGAPIHDVRVQLCDGSCHDADSTDDAFRRAAFGAAEDAARKADPVLLEPIMRVDIVVPAECRDDVIRSVLARRGVTQSIQDAGGNAVIRARIPLAELSGYRADLGSRTRGRGTHVIQFDAYEPVRRIDDDDRASVVGAPLRPRPRPKDSRMALPEPDDDDAP
jgi:elongation factor G